MRTKPLCVYTSVTAAAALLVLLILGATGPTPSSAASSQSGCTSDNFEDNCGTPTRYTSVAGSNTVWVTTTATPTVMVNASYNYLLFRDYQDRDICYLGDHPLSPDFQTWSVGHTTTTPDGRTTTTTTTIITTRSDTGAAQTPSVTSYHDSFDGESHEGTGNEPRWGRFRHDPLRLPDQFMARFLNTLMYLAEVITADVISALLFGRWRPRHYQRARRNRLNWSKRMRFRRFRMNAADAMMRIWDACFQIHETLCLGQDDVSGPTYQMISNVQLTEYPATLSTFADVRPSEVIATVASARCLALVSIAFISAPTSAFPDPPHLASRGALPEASTLNLRLPVSPRQLLLLEASEMSAVASCNPRASLPDAGLEVALRPAVRSSSQCLPEVEDGEITHRAERPLTALAPVQFRLQRPVRRPIIKTMNTERERLAVLGINLFLEGLSPPCSATSPATRNNRPTLVAADTNSRNADGTVNTLMRYNNAVQSPATVVEAFDGQADTADEPLPPSFFVCEHYTPDSTRFVSAHGVAYTTTIMSYTHQFNHPTRGDPQEDTPTTTQAGDVLDILWPAINARMRCKLSQACMQTSSSKYHRSSVKAVFASRFSPDESEVALLNDLVRRHL